MKITHTIKIVGDIDRCVTLGQIRALVAKTDQLDANTKLHLVVGRNDQRDPYPDSITITYQDEL